MLGQRVATALVLLAVFLAAVFWFPTPWFALALSLVVLVGAAEWAALTGIEQRALRAAWLAAFSFLLWLVWSHLATAVFYLVAAGSAFWLLVLARLWMSPTSAEPAWLRQLAAVAALVPAWSALVYLHFADLRLLISVFLIVWLADTGAYFCGRAFGKRKLAPLLSPGKTIEGLLGGIVSATVFAVASAVWMGMDPACNLAWTAVCIVTALFSVIGDLWESKLKRIAGVKDSGALLPGHGGVLDRIDSVTAAAPVFVTGLYLSSGVSLECSSFFGLMQ